VSDTLDLAKTAVAAGAPLSVVRFSALTRPDPDKRLPALQVQIYADADAYANAMPTSTQQHTLHASTATLHYVQNG
jgi:hypothetical protein